MTSDFGTSSHFDTVYVPASHQERVLSSELPLLEFDMMPPGDVMIESSLSIFLHTFQQVHKRNKAKRL